MSACTAPTRFVEVPFETSKPANLGVHLTGQRVVSSDHHPEVVVGLDRLAIPVGGEEQLRLHLGGEPLVHHAVPQELRALDAARYLIAVLAVEDVVTVGPAGHRRHQQQVRVPDLLQLVGPVGLEDPLGVEAGVDLELRDRDRLVELLDLRWGCNGGHVSSSSVVPEA
jgi:hypothetical protein